MSTNKTVILAGASGYLGQEIARVISSAGYTVIGIGRSKDSLLNVSSYICCDLVNEVPPLDVTHCQNPVLINAAGAIPASTRLNRGGNANSNVKITGNLLKTALELNASRLIHISSSSVYGPSGTPHSETSKPVPRTAYGLDKLASENQICKATAAHRLTSVILRFPSLYGGEMPPANNTARLIDAVCRNRFIIPGDGSNKKSLLHVADAAQAVAAVLEDFARVTPGAVEVFNVAPSPVSINEIAEAIAAAVSRHPPRHLPQPLLRATVSVVGLLPFPAIQRATQALHKLASNDVLDSRKFNQTFPGTLKRDTVQEIKSLASQWKATL